MAFSLKNFHFLEACDDKLFEFASQAENYLLSDPNTCLMKARQFGERLAQLIAERTRVFIPNDEKQVERLNKLYQRRVLPYEFYRKLDWLRQKGNDANHNFAGDREIARFSLYLIWELAVYYARRYEILSDTDSPVYIEPAEDRQQLIEHITAVLSNSLKTLDCLEARKIAQPKEFEISKKEVVERVEEIFHHARQRQQCRVAPITPEQLQSLLDKIELEIIRIELEISELQSFAFEFSISTQLASLRRRKEWLTQEKVSMAREGNRALAQPELYTTEEKERKAHLLRQFEELKRQQSETQTRLINQIVHEKANAEQLLQELASYKVMLSTDLLLSLDRHNIKLK